MSSGKHTWLDSRVSHGVARGLALFVGTLAGLGLLGTLRAPGFDANLLWIDLRLLPGWIADIWISALALMLTAWSVRRECGKPFRIALQLLLALTAVAMLWNASVFWWLQVQGHIHAAMPLPLSLLFAAGLLFVMRHVRSTAEPQSHGARVCNPQQRRNTRGPRLSRHSKPLEAAAGYKPALRGRTGPPVHRPAQFAACAACVLVFPLLQVVGFGKTDYRRPAEAAVVFGARAYADGRPSDALADRVRTACQLYRQGLVSRLIFSGGPGDGPVHETESMRRMALQLGVPESAITRDESGLNTAATVLNTRPLLASRSAIAVSEFYHLPRIKLAFQRAGLDVRTVPAQPAHWARTWPLKSMAREIPAFWLYYARAALGAS